MSNTAETITQRIFKKADDDLKREVGDAFNPIISQINASLNNIYNLKVEVGGKDIEINGWAAIESIKKSIISGRTEKVRQDAISEFLSKVESLSSEIDELRNSIPQ